MGIEMAGDDLLREGMTADVEEMDKTIGQFLDFARSEGGETPQEIDVAALLVELRRTVPSARLCGRCGDRSIAVLPAPTSAQPILLRPQALRRAISNLIDNALKYAGTEKPVELAMLTEARELCIEVRDRGPGIPADEVERIKRPFARLESARSNTAGAGLGLAIVERVARTHNGRLELCHEQMAACRPPDTAPPPKLQTHERSGHPLSTHWRRSRRAPPRRTLL
jgi:two-component system osmolarity sensor histidine kinase EnvZ